ncbi:MAG: metallophosphoesterase [Chloroflexi bacterium]|nr:metallophosphoesterase [Chloroflexota bacterium]
MTIWVRQSMVFLMSRSITEIMIGTTMLGMVGIVAEACTSVLVRRHDKTRTRTTEGLPLVLIFLLFCLVDWALLWILPHLRLSFSTEIIPPLITSIFVRLLIFWGLVAVMVLTLWRGRRREATTKPRSAIILFLITNLGFSAVQINAYIVEPLMVETTKVSLASTDLDPDAPPVRVVHLSDIHIERTSFREIQVIQKVNALQPDIIVLTGDYLNLSRLSDPASAAHFRRFVRQLDAPYGIYAVRGSVEPTLESMDWLVKGTDVVWLEQEAVTVNVHGQSITLVGAACSHQQELDRARLTQAMDGVPKDDFTLLLYHSPDLILEAAEHQIDLYLGGHTHGGQLRLPFYGAIVTGSIYGKQYVSGLSEKDGTTMYISRGIGFEGRGMPRARFLCRPEIVSIEIQGQSVTND